MRKLMSLVLVAGISSFMVAGCGGGDTTTDTTTDTSTVYLKDVIKDEQSAKIAFYKALSTNRLYNLENLTSLISYYLTMKIEGIFNDNNLYSSDSNICGNYTVDTDNRTFTFNFDNCSDYGLSFISGRLSGSYQTANRTISSVNISLSDGFSYLYDYKNTLYGATVSAESSYDDSGTWYGDTYNIKADKIEYRYLPDDNYTTPLPCFNETDIAATLTDVTATIKEDNSTYSQEYSYKVEWPPFINAPVMMDYELWSQDYENGTVTGYIKIADGTIVATWDADNNTDENNILFDLKYNGSVIYTGTFENFEDELISYLNENGVCETLTIYP
ncbi:hypothetical protein [Desulfurobacterium atlanticum]|uniref:Uncharacterized protein n=1 Tax=Desulfurobacterium atlanticum TaxID=240169 RepID=A0A239A0S2_9BACT|nr:hypothetical protein [Desulfurobacterium atlanticum]SNR88718.1 hypothetical protein SAMN06265340_11354 [Desulfurobacterium atlanticum]